MKKKLLGFLNILARLTIPIISAVVGLWLLSLYNVFEIFIEIFIKDQDMANDVGITAYFALSDILLNLLYEHIGKTIKNKKQAIRIVFHLPKEEAIIENTPTIKISGTAPTKMKLTITALAQKGLCNNVTIKIPHSSFYTMQLEQPCGFAQVDQSGNLVISISELFGEQTAINATITLCVLLIKDQDIENKSEIKPELSRRPILTDFSYNKANVEIR